MSEELQHHGILGQKWGVRRYQNYDGTLTEAGKKRYGDSGKQNIKNLSERAKKLVKSRPIVTTKHGTINALHIGQIPVGASFTTKDGAFDVKETPIGYAVTVKSSAIKIKNIDSKTVEKGRMAVQRMFDLHT